MPVFFSAKVQGVGAVICAATNPIQFLSYRFSSSEQCDGFLRSVKDAGGALHTGMAHNELQAMVELWRAGQSPKRQPGSPLPLKAPYPRADEVTRELPGVHVQRVDLKTGTVTEEPPVSDESVDAAAYHRSIHKLEGVRYVESQLKPGDANPIISTAQIYRAQGVEPANAPKLTLRGEPLDIVDRYKEKARLQSTERGLPDTFYEKFLEHVDNAKAEAARLVEDRILEKLTPPTVSPGLIDHWLEGSGAEPILDTALEAAFYDEAERRAASVGRSCPVTPGEAIDLGISKRRAENRERMEAEESSDIHAPVRTALPPVPGILRGMAEVVNHEEPRRVWKAVDPSPRDEDFA